MRGGWRRVPVRRGWKTSGGGGRKLWRFRLLACLLVFLIAVCLVDARVRPMIRTLAANEAQILSEEIINGVIAEVMAQQGVDYQSLVTIEKDTGGRITSIQTDAMRMNMLKSQINSLITQRLEEVEKRQIKIPVGSLFGSHMMLGRGPNIRLYLSLSGHANTVFNNVFDGAGVNQTRHQIMLDINTSVYVLIPGYDTSIDIHTNMCIAETVIVGQVPTYAGLGIGSK